MQWFIQRPSEKKGNKLDLKSARGSISKEEKITNFKKVKCNKMSFIELENHTKSDSIMIHIYEHAVKQSHKGT